VTSSPIVPPLVVIDDEPLVELAAAECGFVA
jgi:hypothetical protein